MTNANNYPKFYETTEGRPAVESEMLPEITQTFNGLFDNIMLQYSGEVSNYELFKGEPRASLVKSIDVDGQEFTLALEDRNSEQSDLEDDDKYPLGLSFRDSEIILRQISLQRKVENYGRESWSYRLGPDGIVRRWDGGDSMAKMRKNDELGIEGPRLLRNETIEQLGMIAFTTLQHLITEIPNGRLAEDMGINNQPVSIGEVQGLQEFLAKANDIRR